MEEQKLQNALENWQKLQPLSGEGRGGNCQSVVGVSGNVCIFAASYEVKAKVLKGKTRLGIQPPNTEYLFFYPEIKPRDVLSQVRSCFTISF